MKFKRSMTALGCLAATVLLMAASGGCGSRLHKANVAAGAIGATLHTMATTNHTNQLETAEERTQIANYIAQAATANETFVGLLKAANKNGGQLDTAAALAAFDKLSTQFEQLNDQGILHIKNADAQAKFDLAVSSIKAQIAILRALLDTSTSDSQIPGKHPYAPYLAAIFTPAEIEELIALAISAGSFLLPKLMALRGKNDAEILAAASEDNQAAIAIAVADGADPPKGAE